MRAFRSFAKRHPEKRGSKLLPGRVLWKLIRTFMAVLELLKQQVMEMRYEEDDIIFTAALEGTV